MNTATDVNAVFWSEMAVTGAYYFRDGRTEVINAYKKNNNPIILTTARDPKNIHDSNAIKVLTAGGLQVGWIPAAKNRVLASLMDTFGAEIQAEIVRGSCDFTAPFKITVRVSIVDFNNPNNPNKNISSVQHNATDYEGFL